MSHRLEASKANDLPDSVFLFNTARRLLYLNRQGESFMAAVGRQAVIGQPAEELFAEAVLAPLLQLLEEVLFTAMPDSLHLSYRDAAGQRNVTAVAAPQAGGVVLRLKVLTAASGQGEGVPVVPPPAEDYVNQLKNEKERLELALKGAGLGAWEMYLQDGRASFDQRWTQMLGYEHHEIDASVERWFALVHPEDLPVGNQLLANYLAGGQEVFRFEHRMLTKTGEWKWVVATGKVVEWDAQGQPLRMIGIMQDVAGIKEAESSLHFYKYLIDTIDDPFYWLSTDTYTFTYVNEATCRHFGRSREELLQMAIPDWNPTVNLADSAEIVNKIKQAKSMIIKTVHTNSSGEHIPVEVTSNYLTYAGKEYLVGHIRDVSGQKAVEAELEQRVAQRTAELHASNRELEAFSSSVSHDLRAPLRSIDGFSKAILEDYHDRLDGEGRLLLTRIVAAATRMGRLIDDLLDLSKLSRAELQVKPVNMSLLVQEISHALQQQQPQRQVEVHIRGDVWVEADGKLLHIALENLLSNAWKYTSRLANAYIEFGEQNNGPEQVFYIRDNGAGFDMQQAHRLFGAFQRLHNSQEYEGTGIGLATVQRIISRHGGRIWAEAVPGNGATFYFTLPPHP